MPKTNQKLTASRVLDIIDMSLDSWIKDQGSELEISSRVRRILDGKLSKIILYAIGLKEETSFSRDNLELDTRSPGYKLMIEKVTSMAAAWAYDNLSEYVPVISNEQVGALKKHFEKEYHNRLRSAINSIAGDKAEKDAEFLVKRVPISTDDMRVALRDLIDGDNKDAIAQAIKGKEFIGHTKLKSVTVVDIVSYDGENVSDCTQDPNALCWHVVHLISVMDKVECHILTNGDEWHPFNAYMTADGLSCEDSRVLECFRSANQMIFNFLDDSDRLFIRSAISLHYSSKDTCSSSSDDIPF